MMNRHMLIASAAGILCAHCLCAEAAPTATTMTVQRCLATDENGAQCVYQAEKGKKYCWRHRGVVRSLNKAVDDVGKGTEAAWQSTKTWSSNVWEKTKLGANSVWDDTKKAADNARVGLVELLGGKDAERKSAEKVTTKKK